MALRLPRGPRPRRPAARRRDVLAACIAAAALVVFGLRVVMAALNVRTWTLGWRVINLPTAPFVGLARHLHPLARVEGGRLVYPPTQGGLFDEDAEEDAEDDATGAG